MADEADERIGDARTVRDRFESLGLMAISYHGPELRVVAANAAFRAFAGNQHLVGHTIRELFPEWEGQQLIQVPEHVLRTGESRIGREWRIQVEREDTGQVRECFVDYFAEPYRDTDGTVVGVNGYCIDVSEQVRRRQEEQHRATHAEQRYEQAREVVTELQRRLLPSGLPVLPSAQVAGSYLLVDVENAAGGDWFDAIPVSADRVALVVGDVVGHGVAASAAMGQLRAVLQDRLDETGDVLTAVRAADRVADRVAEASAATVCAALVDLADGTVTCCSAGHPPPLLAGADSARYLPASGNGPLGTGSDYSVVTDRLDLGQVVLLYSDGILERPGREPAAATAELARTVADAVAGRGLADHELSAVDRACTHTLELLVRLTGHTDDITLLAAQRRTPSAPLRLCMPTGPDAIGTARRDLDSWLRNQEAGDEDRSALAHAVSELVTNAVEHGHPDSTAGTITISADLDAGGVVRVVVADDGQWRERSRPGDESFRRDHGLGLAMTARFVDALDLDHDESGTTAILRHRLSRPARLLTTGQLSDGVPVRGPDELRELTLVLDQPHAPGNRIAVYGPLDATNIDHVAAELDRFTLGGTHDLTVDLTAVTHLASTAVKLLSPVSAPGDGHRRPPLCLYAPLGSVAHQVLTLVAVPHTTTDPDVAPGAGGFGAPPDG
ncbi:SpoIIE family protein phosphatase [Amycolatopsis jiangsuensis]|uniref:PAS domain S-box-containing protein n=1 Tax=Amycolatopsis jiangsuensis TaxID=1181879 RepID=A0A840J295_9PSEU|nr:SpoIIE family protein phosphatase [Amycolatopsis jiangsuensis]MBB4689136.1 PAS domain S-box-containing protein [Amycolatopsis jiangsuensis]